MNSRFATAIEEGEAAFWQAVMESYPDAITGDFPPEASHRLQQELEIALRTWLTYNLPKKGE